MSFLLCFFITFIHRKPTQKSSSSNKQIKPSVPNKNMLPVLDFQTRAIQADCRLDNLCALDIDSKPMNFRLSGIVCTIGPATREVPKLVELIKCGMTIARMNFSHGTHEVQTTTTNIFKYFLNFILFLTVSSWHHQKCSRSS